MPDVAEADVSTPDPIGDQIEELAGELFDPDMLGDDLALKCRYLYLHAKIEAAQNQGEEVKDRHMETLNRMEEQLMKRDIRPSSILSP